MFLGYIIFCDISYLHDLICISLIYDLKILTMLPSDYVFSWHNFYMWIGPKNPWKLIIFLFHSYYLKLLHFFRSREYLSRAASSRSCSLAAFISSIPLFLIGNISFYISYLTAYECFIPLCFKVLYLLLTVPLYYFLLLKIISIIIFICQKQYSNIFCCYQVLCFYQTVYNWNKTTYSILQLTLQKGKYQRDYWDWIDP